jgi:SAM-dependent methyltransferase
VAPRLPELRPEYFARLDEADDARFYQQPRLVAHLDGPALQRFYGSIVPDDGQVLDLMSSFVSHLPAEKPLRRLVGLGLNAVELAANRRLSEWLVHNLNREPELPFAAATFDACILSVSIQYLTRPIEVLAAVGRMLRPGAPVAIAFSNRMFPTKAVALWTILDDQGRGQLISEYLARGGHFEPCTVEDLWPAPGRSDPLFVAVTRRLSLKSLSVAKKPQSGRRNKLREKNATSP